MKKNYRKIRKEFKIRDCWIGFSYEVKESLYLNYLIHIGLNSFSRFLLGNICYIDHPNTDPLILYKAIYNEEYSSKQFDFLKIDDLTLSQLQKMPVLFLTKCKIGNLDFLSFLKNLELLVIYDVNITGVSNNMELCKNLERKFHIDIYSNDFTELCGLGNWDLFNDINYYKSSDIISGLKFFTAIPHEIIPGSKYERLADLHYIYNQRVRHYILEDHTYLVINTFIRYFKEYFNRGCWSVIDDLCFIVFLALHDIGKPEAFAKKNMDQQYSFSRNIIKNIWTKLNGKFDDRSLEILLKLLDGDTLGAYFQGKLSLEESANNIIKLSADCSISPSTFLRLFMMYYQCDTASYTADAGGLKFLEYLFEYKDGAKVFDEKKGLIRFSPKYWEMYLKLEKEIEQCQ
jgi:hypothetical protein